MKRLFIALVLMPGVLMCADSNLKGRQFKSVGGTTPPTVDEQDAWLQAGSLQVALMAARQASPKQQNGPTKVTEQSPTREQLIRAVIQSPARVSSGFNAPTTPSRELDSETSPTGKKSTSPNMPTPTIFIGWPEPKQTVLPTQRELFPQRPLPKQPVRDEDLNTMLQDEDDGLHVCPPKTLTRVLSRKERGAGLLSGYYIGHGRKDCSDGSDDDMFGMEP